MKVVYLLFDLCNTWPSLTMIFFRYYPAHSPVTSSQWYLSVKIAITPSHTKSTHHSVTNTLHVQKVRSAVYSVVKIVLKTLMRELYFKSIVWHHLELRRVGVEATRYGAPTSLHWPQFEIALAVDTTYVQ